MKLENYEDNKKMITDLLDTRLKKHGDLCRDKNSLKIISLLLESFYKVESVFMKEFIEYQKANKQTDYSNFEYNGTKKKDDTFKNDVKELNELVNKVSDFISSTSTKDDIEVHYVENFSGKTK